MSDAKRRARDPVTGERVVIEYVTFSERRKWVQKRRYGDKIGTQTSNGFAVQSISAHTVDRAGNRDVSYSGILDAIINPLHSGKVPYAGHRSVSPPVLGRAPEYPEIKIRSRPAGAPPESGAAALIFQSRRDAPGSR